MVETVVREHDDIGGLPHSPVALSLAGPEASLPKGLAPSARLRGSNLGGKNGPEHGCEVCCELAIFETGQYLGIRCARGDPGPKAFELLPDPGRHSVRVVRLKDDRISGRREDVA